MWKLDHYSDEELTDIVIAVKGEQARRSGNLRSCAQCGDQFPGRADALYCTSACRTAAHRAKKRNHTEHGLPAQLTARARWIRHNDKRPITPSGGIARTNDPTTWSTFAQATSSTIGSGLGFVLNGDGIGAYDLDHCIVDGVLTEQAAAFVAGLDAFYVEVSPSGEGVHAFVFAPAQKGSRKTIDGLSVEFYTQGRFLTMTGESL